jgi:hypothetical protein
VNYYTEEETAIAKAGLEAGKSNRDIITDLRLAGYHRGVTSISKFAQKHGYDRSVDPWTPEQIARMKELYERKVPPKQIAEELGKPIQSIRSRASNMGLKQRVGWSDTEYELLQKLWRQGKKLGEAVLLIGRPYPNVAKIASNLGLSFNIDPSERGKAASLLKKAAALPEPKKPRGRPRKLAPASTKQNQRQKRKGRRA